MHIYIHIYIYIYIYWIHIYIYIYIYTEMKRSYHITWQRRTDVKFWSFINSQNSLETVEWLKLVGKPDLLLTSLPVLIAQTVLCLARILGAATRLAFSKSPEKLKKISTRHLKDYVKKTIPLQFFLLISRRILNSVLPKNLFLKNRK